MKEYKCIEIFRYHLSEQTRNQFIMPVTANQGCIETPPIAMPSGISLAITQKPVKVYIQINRNNFLLKRENNPSQPELPEDTTEKKKKKRLYPNYRYTTIIMLKC